jgi:hypothetical protein
MNLDLDLKSPIGEGPIDMAYSDGGEDAGWHGEDDEVLLLVPFVPDLLSCEKVTSLKGCNLG